MPLEIKGTLSQKLAVQTGTSKAGKQWAKQDFLIETPGEYPKTVCITSWKPEVLEQYQLGEELTVSLELSSREHNGKYYSEIRAWKISGKASAPARAQTQAPVVEPEPFDDIEKGDDDLPF